MYDEGKEEKMMKQKTQKKEKKCGASKGLFSQP